MTITLDIRDGSGRKLTAHDVSHFEIGIGSVYVEFSDGSEQEIVGTIDGGRA